MFRRIATRQQQLCRQTMVVLGVLLYVSLNSEAEAKSSPRIVSMHHCMDQYVMDLADPEQIVSLSNVSQAPSVSFKAAYAKAQNFGRNRGTAEEILPLKPDIVFAGFYWMEAQTLLKRFGVQIENIGAPQDISQLKLQIRRVAKLVEQVDRGENLIQRIDHELALFDEENARNQPSAGLFYSGGYTQGKGTYFNDMLEKSGFQNVAAQSGMQGYGHVSLEQMVMIQPEVIFIDKDSRHRADRIASSFMEHPALRRSIPDAQREHLPSKVWVCGGESTIAVLKMLRKARQVHERKTP